MNDFGCSSICTWVAKSPDQCSSWWMMNHSWHIPCQRTLIQFSLPVISIHRGKTFVRIWIWRDWKEEFSTLTLLSSVSHTWTRHVYRWNNFCNYNNEKEQMCELSLRIQVWSKCDNNFPGMNHLRITAVFLVVALINIVELSRIPPKGAISCFEDGVQYDLGDCVPNRDPCCTCHCVSGGLVRCVCMSCGIPYCGPDVQPIMDDRDVCCPYCPGSRSRALNQCWFRIHFCNAIKEHHKRAINKGFSQRMFSHALCLTWYTTWREQRSKWWEYPIVNNTKVPEDHHFVIESLNQPIWINILSRLLNFILLV